MSCISFAAHDQKRDGPQTKKQQTAHQTVNKTNLRLSRCERKSNVGYCLFCFFTCAFSVSSRPYGFSHRTLCVSSR